MRRLIIILLVLMSIQACAPAGETPNVRTSVCGRPSFAVKRRNAPSGDLRTIPRSWALIQIAPSGVSAIP